ncbi:hypothetical protein GCM10010383_64920 [Streptomyces lomondensis]|uniref:Uncharacterized protein n=1 Tax=Streptomyces lomondensis TaxID=68229 RepID=A0ABQ2XPF7_9ACTN|nr:hypothetical protein GCM10010383_64920 [Streptomyces lomondensis]
MITTYKSGGVPYLTYHSTNTYRKSVKSLVAQYPRATYHAFRTWRERTPPVAASRRAAHGRPLCGTAHGVRRRRRVRQSEVS